MELRNYATPLLRWWWLILVSIAMAGAISCYSTRNLPLAYQSRTTLIIGQSISSPNPSPGQFALEQQLALIYADMARREPLRRAVMEALGLNEMPGYVARALPDTQLIEITVTDSNPARARAVAAELAYQLILRAPTQALPDEQERQEFVDEQLSALQVDIGATQDDIDELNAQLGDMNSAQQIAETERQISALELKLTSLQSNYASLLASTQKGALNTLSIVEPAELPIRPMGSNRAATVALAGALGGVLAALGAYVIEALDETVENSAQATTILNLPLLAEIPRLRPPLNTKTYVSEKPLSQAADAFRTLRTNLEAGGVGERIKTVLVTSAGVGDGKSTVAANLAASLAKLRRRVILVDADFHQSTLNIEHEKGLSDLLMDPANPSDYLVTGQNPELFYMGKGSRPSELSELLGSSDVDRVFIELTSMADVIVIDSPPLILSDALALATKSDGVVLVVRPKVTRRAELARVRLQLAAVKAKVMGFVMNGARSRVGDYYNHYYQEAAGAQEAGTGGWIGRALRGKPGRATETERTGKAQKTGHDFDNSNGATSTSTEY